MEYRLFAAGAYGFATPSYSTEREARAQAKRDATALHLSIGVYLTTDLNPGKALWLGSYISRWTRGKGYSVRWARQRSNVVTNHPL